MEKTISITLTQGNGTGNTATISQLFEHYKESYNEESPQSEEQKESLQDLEWHLDTLSQRNRTESTAYQEFFDTAITMARASEKSGFILGFKMAMNIMCECAR